MLQSKMELEQEDLTKAIELVEKLESGVDIFTLNKAIAVILERRARNSSVCHEWISKKLEDIEQVPENKIGPLVMDLS